MDRYKQTMNPDQTQAIKTLIVEVVRQAKRDAGSRNPAKRQEAIAWLLADGQTWIDAITDIHPDHVRSWATDRRPVSNPNARCDRRQSKNRTERPRTAATA
jgi:hypothetical protein